MGNVSALPIVAAGRQLGNDFALGSYRRITIINTKIKKIFDDGVVMVLSTSIYGNLLWP